MTAPRSRLARSAKARLVALLGGAVVGQVYQAGNGRLTFRYEESWRRATGAYPLSLSMPLASAEHGDRAVRAFLWGLVPEDPAVLEWWARRYGVSRYRIVDVLEHVGEDCAGAVQFAVPARVPALLGSPTVREAEDSTDWISSTDLERRLKDLRLNPAASRAANDTGQFSLAGAQAKTALFQDEYGRWGIPKGRVPTNRILKPQTSGLDDLAYNEHYCLLLARELGMPAALSSVQTFGEETAIVVERYDRARIGDQWVRVHQEDMCQAHGIRPTRKYETDGGPGIVAISELLTASSTESATDTMRFVDAMALNWFLAATDGHAKNYSVMHGSGPQLRLAPLYDVISVLPYPKLTKGRGMLAMSVDGERRVDAINGQHWRGLARRIGVLPEMLTERVRSLGQRVERAVESLASQRHADAHVEEVMSRLGESVLEHCGVCQRRL